MITINAVGDDFEPYIIAPLINLPKEELDLVRRKKVIIGGSQNGWMTDETFQSWAKWLILKVISIREQRNYQPSQKAVLFLDGHITRNQKSVMEEFKNANIEVIIFPPHMTHIIQPFDKVIARPLKQILRQIANDIINEYAENVCIP